MGNFPGREKWDGKTRNPDGAFSESHEMTRSEEEKNIDAISKQNLVHLLRAINWALLLTPVAVVISWLFYFESIVALVSLFFHLVEMHLIGPLPFRELACALGVMAAITGYSYFAIAVINLFAALVMVSAPLLFYILHIISNKIR